MRDICKYFILNDQIARRRSQFLNFPSRRWRCLYLVHSIVPLTSATRQRHVNYQSLMRFESGRIARARHNVHPIFSFHQNALTFIIFLTKKNSVIEHFDDSNNLKKKNLQVLTCLNVENVGIVSNLIFIILFIGFLLQLDKFFSIFKNFRLNAL